MPDSAEKSLALSELDTGTKHGIAEAVAVDRQYSKGFWGCSTTTAGFTCGPPQRLISRDILRRAVFGARVSTS